MAMTSYPGFDAVSWRPTLAGRSQAVATTGLLHAGADPRREAYAIAW